MSELWSPGAALLGQAALLLMAAGALKLADPSRTVGALRALGWPASPGLVRAGALVELVVGAAALVVGGPVAAGLVAASFVAFALFTIVAMRARVPIGTCGCFAEADTPPRWRHVVVDLLLAVGAVASIAIGDSSVADDPVALIPAAAVAAAAFNVLTARPEPGPATAPPAAA